MNAFELSRIYGSGWNAAKKALSDVSVDVEEIEIESLNPHRSGEERERWAAGFSEALRARTGRIAARTRGTPLPAPKSEYRFKLGEIVKLTQNMYERLTPDDMFEIVRLLPVENGVVRYQVKSQKDKRERVVEETRLT